MPMSPRLLRPRASSAAFSPQSVSGLATWWDFSDLSTLAQNSDGTGSVSTNGDAVGYIRDKVGSANLTQPTNNLRGSLVTSGIGGRASVSIPNTSGAGYQFTGAQRTDTTWFIVARYTGSGSWLTVNAGTVFFIDASQSGDSQTPNNPGATGSVATFRVNGSAITATRTALRAACGVNASYLLAITGINHRVSETPASWWPTTANAWRLGTYTGFAFIGQFAEVLWYSRSLSATETSSVESYLKAKWGTP